MTDIEFKQKQHLYMLKSIAFHDNALYNWNFENDNSKNPVMSKAKIYVDKWSEMYSKNIGLLLWGEVGTGKSYFAACIANALIEKGVSLTMRNFSTILNDLFSLSEDKNKYLNRLINHSLLIIDDLGIERNTEYALEQVYNVVDARYKSNKPLIVTTNLSLTELKNPIDTAHNRIYDRVLEMCVPICFNGENFRKSKAEAKMNMIKELFEEVGK